MNQSKLNTVKVRCGVCRGHSARFDGSNRADLVGYVEVTDGGVEFWETTRTARKSVGYLQTTSGLKPHTWTDRRDGNMVALRSVSETIRVRCRSGHDLRVSPERFNAALSRHRGDTLYLDGS